MGLACTPIRNLKQLNKRTNVKCSRELNVTSNKLVLSVITSSLISEISNTSIKKRQPYCTFLYADLKKPQVILIT